MQNSINIQFDVTDFEIKNRNNQNIPSGNRNFIFIRFHFSPSWNNLNKTAIFSQGDIQPIHCPIENNMCQIPNVLMVDKGIINVSVFAGNRRTVNTAQIEVKQGGYVEGVPPFPPEPTFIYVQSPNGSITQIRHYDGEFQYYSFDEWHSVIGSVGGGFDPSVLNRITVLEDKVSINTSNINDLSNEILGVSELQQINLDLIGELLWE